MESRKDQLKAQIVQALKSNDNDLYILLKSQWAHRFGVESLEELNNLDFNKVDQNLKKEDNQKIDESKDNGVEDDQVMAIEDGNDLIEDQENEVINYNQKVDKYPEDNLLNLSQGKLNEKVVITKQEGKTSYLDLENRNIPKVEPLIPIPPKSKYGYLKKWIRSRN